MVLLLGHRADEVWAAAGAGAPRGLRLVRSVEPEPLGTGGAIRLAGPLLDDRFLVMNGDTFLALDLPRSTAAPVAAPAGWWPRWRWCAPAGRPKGTVRLDPDGHVVDFAEKGAEGPGLINAGVYLVEKSGLGDVPSGRAVSLEREIFPL